MKRNQITDADLLRVVKQTEDGLIDANLGGGLIKQRIARPNQGKSGGFRSILIFRASDRIIFIYGFAKNNRGNIHSDELKTLKGLAAELLAYNEKQLKQAIKQGALIVVQDTIGEHNRVSKMSKTYKSDILAAVHETAQGLYDAGVMDKQTMRNFDAACLTKVEPMPPDKIKALREQYNVSQSVFALYLNVTVGLVSKWERGDKRPAGASLKLLTLVEKNGLDAIA